MKKQTKQLWLTSIFLILIVSFTTLCYSNDNSDDLDYDANQFDEQLELLYLGVNYLLPYQPGPGPINKTELFTFNQSIFSLNIRDRKFNNEITPELGLWINTQGKSGIKLEFEIIFQAVEDNTLLPNKNYKAVFENHTTNGTQEFENIIPKFVEYQGETFDVKSGSENWCSVILKIKRVDNETDSKLYIYSGADGKISHIKIPYDQTLSAYEYERDKEKDQKNTPDFTLGQIILVFMVLLVIYQSRRHQIKK